MSWVALAGIAVGFGLVVILPIVGILTEHQRKMARILHGMEERNENLFDPISLPDGLKGPHSDKPGKSDEVLNELRALRAEVSILRDEVSVLKGSVEGGVRERLSQSS